KELQVYALLVGKGGPKIEHAEAGGGLRMMMGPKGRHISGNATIAQLADSLSNFIDRPVVDMTELKGSYTIDLEFTSEGGPGGMMRMGMGGPGPGGPAGGGPGPGGPAGGGAGGADRHNDE